MRAADSFYKTPLGDIGAGTGLSFSESERLVYIDASPDIELINPESSYELFVFGSVEFTI